MTRPADPPLGVLSDRAWLAWTTIRDSDPGRVWFGMDLRRATQYPDTTRPEVRRGVHPLRCPFTAGSARKALEELERAGLVVPDGIGFRVAS